MSWLNLDEAAELAGCSRKTLYRYMTKGLLPYRKEANNRRYVQRKQVEELFQVNKRHKDNSKKKIYDLSDLIKELSADIERHNILLKRMISLYQPKTLTELINKRRR